VSVYDVVQQNDFMSSAVLVASHEVALPTSALVSPDTTERIEKFFGMRAFGYGAELFPHLGFSEARALRLLSKLLNLSVDQRTWVRVSSRMDRSFVCVCTHA
jgi:hypothetical protein